MQILSNKNQIFRTHYKIRKNTYKFNKNQDNTGIIYTD